MIKVNEGMVQIEGEEITIMSEINMIFHSLKIHDIKVDSFSSIIYTFMKQDLCREEREEFLYYLKLLINAKGFNKEGEED